MFRKVTHSPEPGPATEIAIEAFKKSMQLSKAIIITLLAILVIGLITVQLDPDLIGRTGKRVLGAAGAMILFKAIDWTHEYQKLKKLLRGRG